MTSLSESEIHEAAALLSRIAVGKLPGAVFHEIARLAVQPAVEIIPLRRESNGQISVLLTQRDENDPVWPLQWHTPGRILRGSDVDGSGTYELAIKRLLETELPGVQLKGPATLVTTEFRQVQRGAEFALLHWMEVIDKEPRIGKLFPVTALPANIVDHHPRMIHKVAEHFA